MKPIAFDRGIFAQDRRYSCRRSLLLRRAVASGNNIMLACGCGRSGYAPVIELEMGASTAI